MFTSIAILFILLAHGASSSQQPKTEEACPATSAHHDGGSLNATGRVHALVDQAVRFIELLPRDQMHGDEDALPLEAFTQAVALVEEADNELIKANRLVGDKGSIQGAHALLQDGKVKLQEAFAYLYKGAKSKARREVLDVLEGIQNAGVLMPDSLQKPDTSDEKSNSPTIPIVTSDEVYTSPHPPRVTSPASAGTSGPEAPSFHRSHSNIPHSEPGPVPYSQRHAEEWRAGFDASVAKLLRDLVSRVQRLPWPKAVQEQAHRVAQQMNYSAQGLLQWWWPRA